MPNEQVLGALTARILIVDDEGVVREVLEKVLQKFNHTVLVASSYEEAKAIFAKEQFDLALIDVNLKAHSGFDLLSEFRHLVPLTEFIMISGILSPEFPVQALRSGAAGYLIKPVTVDGLRHEINRVLTLRNSLLFEKDQVAQLQEDLEFRTRELLQVHGTNLAFQRSLITALCRLAEFRDNETGSHLYRMADYCRHIAAGLRGDEKYRTQIDELFISRLHMAAPLHDIGKAGIPDAILLKQGALTPEEMTIMKTHSIIGYNILHDSVKTMSSGEAGIVRMGMEVCRSHHEKVDGSGYPDGLVGDEIPISARIATLADFYDALSQPRIYRSSVYSHDQIKEIIQKQTGIHFDPDVVEAFLRMEHRILKTRQKRDDELLASTTSPQANGMP